MNCQMCEQREATGYITVVIAGTDREICRIYICQSCADERDRKTAEFQANRHRAKRGGAA